MLGEGKTHTHPREANKATYARVCVYAHVLCKHSCLHANVCKYTQDRTVALRALCECIVALDKCAHLCAMPECHDVALLVRVLVLWHT